MTDEEANNDVDAGVDATVVIDCAAAPLAVDAARVVAAAAAAVAVVHFAPELRASMLSAFAS